MRSRAAPGRAGCRPRSCAGRPDRRRAGSAPAARAAPARRRAAPRPDRREAGRQAVVHDRELGRHLRHVVEDAPRAVVADGDHPLGALEVERQRHPVVEPVDRVVVLGKGDPVGAVQHEDAGREGGQRDRVLGAEDDVDALAAQRQRHRDLVPEQLRARLDDEVAGGRVAVPLARGLGGEDEHVLVPRVAPHQAPGDPLRVDPGPVTLVDVAQQQRYPHQVPVRPPRPARPAWMARSLCTGGVAPDGLLPRFPPRGQRGGRSPSGTRQRRRPNRKALLHRSPRGWKAGATARHQALRAANSRKPAPACRTSPSGRPRRRSRGRASAGAAAPRPALAEAPRPSSPDGGAGPRP